MNFLKKYGMATTLILVVFAALFAFSFKADNANAVITEVQPDGSFFDYDRAGTYYAYTWTKDTITDAANDTLYLPSNMRPVLSNFTGCVSVTRTNISGTTNLAVKLEETTYPYSGSTKPSAGWASALKVGGSAAATAATTATTENLAIPDLYGMNYRIIIDGTGTQSSSYVIRLLLKKKYQD